MVTTATHRSLRRVRRWPSSSKRLGHRTKDIRYQFHSFSDSVGFSTIGGAPTRELSSATGLETHGLTDRERGSIGPDCSDDEHAVDTMSIHTDGQEHNLDPDTEPVSDHPAASSSGPVADTKSDARLTSRDDREGLGGDESSSSIADTTSDALSASQDSHMDLSEGESESLSGGSVYESCEDL